MSPATGMFLKQIKFRKGNEKKTSGIVYAGRIKTLKYSRRIYVGDRIPAGGSPCKRHYMLSPGERGITGPSFRKIRLLVRQNLSPFRAESLWAMMTGIRDRVQLVTRYLASLRFLIRSLLQRLLNRSFW